MRTNRLSDKKGVEVGVAPASSLNSNSNVCVGLSIVAVAELSVS